MIESGDGSRRFSLLGVILIAIILVAGASLLWSQLRPRTRAAEVTTSQIEASTSRETFSAVTIPTSTPKPETSIEYTLTIQDPHSGRIHVKGIIHNPEGDQVVLGRGQAGSRQVPPISNFVPTLASFSGPRYNFLETVTFPTDGKTDVEFEYDADLSPRALKSTAGYVSYHWYLNGQFGAATPEQLILYPLASTGEHYLSLHNIMIQFQTLNGWEVLTRWDREGDHYRARSTPEFILGFLGFGRFDRVSREIGGTNVTVAFTGIPKVQQKSLSDSVFTLYGYYTTKLGRMIDSTYLPRDRYYVLYVPSPEGRPVESDRAWGFYRSTEEPERTAAHEVFHEWNGDSGAFFGSFFLTEGLTTYYEYHALSKTGLWTRDQYFQGLIREYNEYKQRIVGTSSDVSLEPPRSGIDLDLYYRKGAVVGYLLNEEMSKVTDGERDMDDLMRYLFEHWAMQNPHPEAWYAPYESAYFVSANDLLKAVNTVTGHDFTRFFGAYVFGTAQLPISIEGGELRIRYEELPLIIPDWSGIDYWNSLMIALKIDGTILSDLPTSDMKQNLICS
jgi:hypothetical protein